MCFLSVSASHRLMRKQGSSYRNAFIYQLPYIKPPRDRPDSRKSREIRDFPYKVQRDKCSTNDMMSVWGNISVRSEKPIFWTSYRFPNTCDEFPLGAYDEFEYSWILRIKQEFKRMNPSEFQWIRVMLRVRADRSNKRLPSRFHLILDLNPEF